MNYNLSKPPGQKEQKKSVLTGLKQLLGLMTGEKKILTLAFVFIMINASLSLIAPVLIGYTIDHYVQTKIYHGVLVFSGILLGMYIINLATSYLQTKLMGTVGQRLLFNLRNTLFNKLQELPVDFFNQNRAGDLISRINNDTDKINQFFSQSLVQFLSSIFIMTGAAIFLLSINLTLGAAALSPAILIWLITKVITPWVKSRNALSMKNVGNLSAEIQESLNNFKVIIAFNRRDYFRKRFEEVNEENYSSAIKAGIANNTFMPVYGLFSNIGQLIVLAFGIYLIAAGQFSIGLLISFLAYINNFYNPLRQLAALWANLQVALAGWDRIAQILSLETNLNVIDDIKCETSNLLLSFNRVTFSYPNGKEVLHRVSFNLEQGKTYAFVGPTGGGKTTAASLIARLYDATKGTVLLDGKDIRTYNAEERTDKVGFILQEPFLFTGNVRDNILYGNKQFSNFSNGQLIDAIKEAGLESLIERFDNGLDTLIDTTGDGISLGQKQLIAFMRAVLRKPQLLVLDEATANIDTVTEKLLEEILRKLPSTTTRVIIAHRLNTIENADEIYFVNSGNVTRAGSLDDAVKLLLSGRLES
jgi:ATP-binding cassette, subfamily B, bacterial